MPVTIRPIEPGDRAGWDTLYAAYAASYRVEQTDAMRDQVWSWLHDASHAVGGFVAVAGGDTGGDGGDGGGECDDTELVGLIHFHPFPRPLFAAIACYIDDLFVTLAGRRSSAALQLLQAVDEMSRANGWTMIRGVTKERNYGARVIYDRFAERTSWVVYERRPHE